jgi:hypothetical protein
MNECICEGGDFTPEIKSFCLVLNLLARGRDNNRPFLSDGEFRAEGGGVQLPSPKGDLQMKKSITLIVGMLLFALVAGATDVPKFETFLGYTYMRTDLGDNTILGQSINNSFSMDGGSAQFIYNFNKWFGGAVDLGAVNRGNVGVLNVNFGDRRAFFMAGPRLSYRSASRFTPYFELLFGASRRSLTDQVSVLTGSNTPGLPVVTPYDNLFPGPGVEVTAQVSASQTDFAMVTGGGLDMRISKRFTFRPIAVDYVYTTFPSLLTGKGSSQNGLRASIGLTFTFGAR